MIAVVGNTRAILHNLHLGTWVRLQLVGQQILRPQCRERALIAREGYLLVLHLCHFFRTRVFHEPVGEEVLGTPRREGALVAEMARFLPAFLLEL